MLFTISNILNIIVRPLFHHVLQLLTYKESRILPSSTEPFKHATDLKILLAS